MYIVHCTVGLHILYSITACNAVVYGTGLYVRLMPVTCTYVVKLSSGNKPSYGNAKGKPFIHC
jgi:hypothetical protein